MMQGKSKVFRRVCWRCVEQTDLGKSLTRLSQRDVVYRTSTGNCSMCGEPMGGRLGFVIPKRYWEFENADGILDALEGEEFALKLHIVNSEFYINEARRMCKGWIEVELVAFGNHRHNIVCRTKEPPTSCDWHYHMSFEDVKNMFPVGQIQILPDLDWSR